MKRTVLVRRGTAKAANTTPVPTPILVIAGNYRQAQDYARLRGWESPDWAFVDSPGMLLGHGRQLFYVKIGDWYDRSDINVLNDTLDSIKAERVNIYGS